MRSKGAYSIFDSARLIIVMVALAVSTTVLLGGCAGLTEADVLALFEEKADLFVGPAGEQGEQGDQGPAGLQGPQGSPGEAELGAPGAPGQNGVDGDRGDDGEPGEQGEQGLQGEQGQQGPQGDQGEPGQDAATFIVASEAELRTAIDSLAPEGGRIVVRAGTYTLTRSIDIARDNVIIEGEGSGTYFRMGDGQYDPCFVLGEPTPAEPTITHRNITLRRMRIDGNRLGNPDSELSNEPGRGHLRNNCVTIRRCVDTSLEDVILESARSGGVVTEKGCENILISRVTAFDHHFDGIACYVTTRSFIVDCTARDNQYSGLSCDLGFRDNIVADCFFINNGLNVSVPGVLHPGVFWRDATGNLLANSRLSGNMGDGIFVADGDPPGNLPTSENQFVDNFYTDNGRDGFWQAGRNSENNVLHGGIFKGNARNAINEEFPGTAPLIKYDVTMLP